MAGTQNPSGGGNIAPTTDGLDEGKRKKYGKHPVYSAELNDFAKRLVNQPLIKFVSRVWALRILSILPVGAFCIARYVSNNVTNLCFFGIKLTQLSIIGIGLIFGFVLFLCFAHLVQNLDTEVVKKKFQECGLEIAKKEHYLKQADRDLNKIHNLFQLIIPSTIVILIFGATSIISLLDGVECAEKDEKCLSAGHRFNLIFEEMLLPLILLSVACLLFLLSVMKLYALKANLLIKALHELPDEPVRLKYSMKIYGIFKIYRGRKPIIFRRFH